MILCRILLFLCVISSPILAQELNDSIPKSYKLPDEQYKAWKAIEQEWMSKEYDKILKENKLKMSCSGCENIFMDVIFVIDDKGKLNGYKTVKTRKCAGEFSRKLEERFMTWFMNLNFPSELRNIKFEARLGTGLKC